MLSKNDIERLLLEVDKKLKEKGKSGELIIAGGATLALVFDARNSTKDIDALFRPSEEFREIINEIANENELEEDWLNDGVKGFFTDKMHADLYKKFDNLSVYTVDPESMLALKLTSARFASKDMDDSIVLMKHIGIKTENELFDIIERYTSKNQQTINSHYFTKEVFAKYQKEIIYEQQCKHPMEEKQHAQGESIADWKAEIEKEKNNDQRSTKFYNEISKNKNLKER